MRPKTQNPLNLKLLLIIVITSSLILFFTLKLTLPSASPSPSLQSSRKAKGGARCSPAKIPTSVAQALVHYTTSSITPQQTLKEISVTSKILDRRSPCNFLVFGLGHDSLMWHSLNHGGRTVFLEEDAAWIEQIRRRFPMLESYHVAYGSRVSEARDLMQVGRGPECTAVADPRYSMCQLALKGLPPLVYGVHWDLIMVDAPTGYYDDAPGRMAAIYTAGMMARNRVGGETHVFVHDVNREVEDQFSREFLCEGYMRKQEGRLRHFLIPTHRDDANTPFCPTTT
ncbi:glucuronoxylan 4-O-methyltransferase 1-like [Salvia miltiorrhiza]|uniref:glucuronoxylan 4-O-methyltransferase 1-like n=1 Tax=Salvia miltiorrhiza TaxID=226208 RepID=UPI0025AD46D7|nr:glucuronoxylan 4-O-methyltransferase 1-like [Salvia miltiorrhiza]